MEKELWKRKRSWHQYVSQRRTPPLYRINTELQGRHQERQNITHMKTNMNGKGVGDEMPRQGQTLLKRKEMYLGKSALSIFNYRNWVNG